MRKKFSIPTHLASPDNASLGMLAKLPAMHRFADLIWRLFGLNIGLLSTDGDCFTSSGSIGRVNPFCAALQRNPKLLSICVESDRTGLAHALRGKTPVCYRCFAGLREFVVPIVINHKVEAIVLSGQILDRKPTIRDWLRTRAKLQQYGFQTKHIAPLQPLFMQSRVLSKSKQRDVMTLLSLFTAQIAKLELLKLKNDSTPPLVQRAKTILEQKLTEQIALADVATALNTSTRHLSRVFKSATGQTVLDHLHDLRVEKACQQLAETRDTCAEIAFACGFGSIQQFNRIFKARQSSPPAAWRKKHFGK